MTVRVVFFSLSKTNVTFIIIIIFRKMLIFPDAVPDTFTEPLKQPTTVNNEDDSTDRGK